jgi:hypothetical protein
MTMKHYEHTSYKINRQIRNNKIVLGVQNTARCSKEQFVYSVSINDTL